MFRHPRQDSNMKSIFVPDDAALPIDFNATLPMSGDSVTACSDEVKARTLDHVVKHLQNVILTETRERERKRANIALKHITKWAKHYDGKRS